MDLDKLDPRNAFVKDYLGIILENFDDGIYITDQEANTVYLNHSYELISGLRKSEMIGKNMKALVGSGVVSMSGSLLVLDTGEPVTSEQISGLENVRLLQVRRYLKMKRKQSDYGCDDRTGDYGDLFDS